MFHIFLGKKIRDIESKLQDNTIRPNITELATRKQFQR